MPQYLKRPAGRLSGSGNLKPWALGGAAYAIQPPISPGPGRIPPVSDILDIFLLPRRGPDGMRHAPCAGTLHKSRRHESLRPLLPRPLRPCGGESLVTRDRPSHWRHGDRLQRSSSFRGC